MGPVAIEIFQKTELFSSAALLVTLCIICSTYRIFSLLIAGAQVNHGNSKALSKTFPLLPSAKATNWVEQQTGQPKIKKKTPAQEQATTATTEINIKSTEQAQRHHSLTNTAKMKPPSLLSILDLFPNLGLIVVLVPPTEDGRRHNVGGGGSCRNLGGV